MTGPKNPYPLKHEKGLVIHKFSNKIMKIAHYDLVEQDYMLRILDKPEGVIFAKPEEIKPASKLVKLLYETV